MRDYIFVFRPSEIGDYQTCVGLERKHAHAATVSKWRRRVKYMLTLLRYIY
jgi:hypothetical protein